MKGKYFRNKKRKLSDVISTVVIILVIMAGVSLLAYPTVSNWWNTLHQSRVLSYYVANMQDISQEDYANYLEAARKYNQKLAKYGVGPQSDTDALSEYNNLLNPSGNGVMGYVSIPKIDVKLPIYHGTSDNVLQVAVGHLYGSSLPVGGEGTHACLSGHTGLPRATLFTNLTELVEGDKFMLQVMGNLLTYQVDRIKVVEPSDVSDLQVEEGKDYCTLSTCTPYGVNSHRLLVRGVRIPNDPVDEVAMKHEFQGADEQSLWLSVWPYLVVIICIVLIAIGFLVWKKNQKKIESEVCVDE